MNKQQSINERLYAMKVFREALEVAIQVRFDNIDDRMNEADVIALLDQTFTRCTEKLT